MKKGKRSRATALARLAKKGLDELANMPGLSQEQRIALRQALGTERCRKARPTELPERPSLLWPAPTWPLDDEDLEQILRRQAGALGLCPA